MLVCNYQSFGAVPVTWIPNPKEQYRPDTSCTHVIQMAFKDGTSKEQIQELQQGCIKMSMAVKEIASLTMFYDLKLESGQKHPAGKNRECCIIATFESADDYEAYAVHPEQVKMLDEVLKPMAEPGSRAALQFLGKCPKEALLQYVGCEVKHIVMLQCREGTTAKQMQAVKDGAKKMKEQIPQLTFIDVFRDAGGEKYPPPSPKKGREPPAGNNRDLCIMAAFKSAEDYDIYAAHEMHKQMIADTIAPILEPGTRSAIQFERGEKII